MYHAPTDLDAALDLMAGASGTVIAGGTDVYPAAGAGPVPQTMLDVTGIAGLSDIDTGPNGVRIGAAVRWSTLARADLPPAFDALKTAARAVGSVQIQNAGTLGGNLCTASPAADGVPPLLILDAAVEVSSAAGGTRQLPLSAFLTGPRQTALQPGELLTAILIPPPSAGLGSAFEKLGSRRYLVISITMVAAAVALDDAGRVRDARVAVGAASPVACRLPALEAALVGRNAQDFAIDPAHLAPLAPIDDVRGSAAYRRDAVAEQCRRALRRAASA